MNIADSKHRYPLLEGGGEMGELTRNFDWSKTLLGTPDTWPASLCTTLSIILNSKFPMFLFWGKEHICFYNDAYRPSLGSMGKHPRALASKGADIWPEIWDFNKPRLNAILAGGEATWEEDQLLPIYRNGKLEDVYWTYSYSPVKDETGAIQGVFVTCTETTKKVQLFSELQRAQQRLEEGYNELLTLFEQSPVGIATISAENELVFQYANSFYGQLVARRPDQIISKPLLEALPELKGQGFDEILKDVIATKSPFIAPEVAVDILQNGELTTIYVDLTYQPRKGSGDNIESILVVATDVTQQVRSRKAIEESESKLRAILATAPAGIGVFVGRDLVIENPNQTFIDIVGKGSHIVGLPLREAMPELITEGQPFLNILDDVFTSGKPFLSPNSLVKIVQDGVLQDNYYNISYSPIRNAKGEVYAILDIAIDVTQEVKHRQQLEEAQGSLREAVELAQLGTWSIDVASQGLSFSDRLIEWFGYDPATQAYQQVIPILEAGDQQRVDRAVAWALNPASDGVYNEIYTVIHPQTGHKRILHARGKTVFDAAGNAVRLNGTAQDITLQRELQLALEQQVQQRTEELASVNEELAATNEELAANNEELEESNSLLFRSNENLQQFAYVASHDLQEPLRKIQSFGDLLASQYGSELGEGKAFLERMQAASSRMSTLIKDLLSFSRIATQRDTSGPIALAEVVQTVLTDLELIITERGAVVEVADLPTVEGDRSQLEQLFQNLLSNALKFQKPNMVPHVQIKTSRLAAEDLPVGIKPAPKAVHYYRIDVIDNGVGFDEKYLDRIFQVFQRLYGKNEFSGTGIGLAICEKVMTNHGGAITATSQLGQGATFTVYLPR